jgi:hypothetical protein
MFKTRPKLIFIDLQKFGWEKGLALANKPA